MTFRRFLSWITVFAMILSCAAPVWAAEGDDLNWVLTSDGVLTISGKGSMSASPWAPHSAEITKVVIEEGCTSICNNAFYECPLLTEVSIPESLTYIAENAFIECPRLETVYIPSGVERIHPDAFYGCPNLTRIDVSADNLNYASDSYGVVYSKDMSLLLIAPRGMTGSYTVPGSVKSAGSEYEVTYHYIDSYNGREYQSTTNYTYYGFSGCMKLTEIVISEGVERIGYCGLRNCDSLQSITIPDSVTEVGTYAISQCNLLEQVNIGSGLKSLSAYCFENCDSLTEINFGSGVRSIEERCFTDCDGLVEVTVPGTIRSLGQYVFYDCYKLETAVLENGISKIEDYAFYYCQNLKEVQLSGTLSSINDGMFYYCRALESITIPSKVVQIDSSAFGDCYNLNKVTFTGNAPEFASSAFNQKNLTFYYPEGDETWNVLIGTNAGQNSSITWVPYEKIETPEEEHPIYVVARGTCGSTISWILETDGTLTISGSGDMNFPMSRSMNPAPWGQFADQITSLVVEQGITSIADSAFLGCTNLEEATIAGSVQSVGDSAFANCTALETVEFSGSAPEFGENCFENVDAVIEHNSLDETWTEDTLKGTGGSVTLVPVVPENVCDQLGHTWVDATCDSAKICSVCGATEGEALGHQYENGTCVRCGAAEAVGLMGDVDGDGMLSYNDALTVLRASIGLATLTTEQEALADFDGDGGLSYNDALMILRASIGL